MMSAKKMRGSNPFIRQIYAPKRNLQIATCGLWKSSESRCVKLTIVLVRVRMGLDALGSVLCCGLQSHKAAGIIQRCNRNRNFLAPEVPPQKWLDVSELSVGVSNRVCSAVENCSKPSVNSPDCGVAAGQDAHDQRSCQPPERQHPHNPHHH